MDSIEKLHKEYQSGLSHLSVKRKLDKVYEEIETDNKKDKPINAYITLSKELAYKQAEEPLDETKPLAGVLVGIKDNIHVKGLKTTCGSQILSNYEAIYDATVVENLKKAGAIIVGKLNMDQFAMGATNETSAFGPVRNPYNRDCVAGGSSGGSAAALAAGHALLTLGSDTGGSVRLPASYCGVVGLKPTYGAISRYGVTAMASGLDQVGPMANNVKDCATLFNVLKSFDVNDPNSIDYPDLDLKKISEFDGKKKIGIIKQFVTDLVKPDILEKFYSMVEKLKKLGCTVEEIDLPHAAYAIMAYFILSRVQSFSALSMFDGVRYGRRQETHDLIKNYEESRGQGFTFEIIKRQMCGNYFLSSTDYYDKARKIQTILYNDMQKAFAHYDLLLSPTGISTAPLIGASASSKVEGFLVDTITAMSNLTATPSLSLNMGYSKEGLPMGIQILGNLKEEQNIFELASVIENLASEDIRH
jgi:aspartyl-tRNA(Asn)/glutamyl-tRNA(Gln) amidotransferase subunit A